MSNIPESTVFYVRNERGELVGKMPEIKKYLWGKTERAREKYQATDWELIFWLNNIASELIARAATKDWLNGRE